MTIVATKAPAINLDELRAAIQSEYATVAEQPEQGFHFHTGRPLARMLGYQDEWLAHAPEASIASFAGTGNPFGVGKLHPGERVVDVGCGAGMDSLIASWMTGPTGRVVGVDMTPEMVAKARSAAAATQATNVEFCAGYGEDLPVDDGWADVVISNGVLNLMPDKSAALAEMARVLKPGGRLQIGDILVQKAVPESAKRQIDLWTGWIAGALLEAELQSAVVAAGFVDFAITWQADVFSGAPQSSSAANFGTLGINFRARKASSPAEWQAALTALACEMPTPPQPATVFAADRFYDAGDKGCAEGPLLEIAVLLGEMRPGQTLEVRATDPSAAQDLPAWCRMVGHRLVAQKGNRYLLRKKGGGSS